MTQVEQVDPHRAGARDLLGVFDLLREVDREFLPPLSARQDTLSLPAAGGLRREGRASEQGLRAYFASMSDESWLVARDRDQVVGVLSYLCAHTEPALAAWSPSNYVTTIAVTPRLRRSGLAGLLYDALDAQARLEAVQWVSTRTWSTNGEHLRLLRARRFIEVARCPRATDNESVYLARPVPGIVPSPSDLSSARFDRRP